MLGLGSYTQQELFAIYVELTLLCYTDPRCAPGLLCMLRLLWCACGALCVLLRAGPTQQSGSRLAAASHC